MKRDFFVHLPIQRKIVLLITVITGTALLIFTSLSIINQIRQLKNSMIDNLDILSATVSRTSPSFLDYPANTTAKQVLGALEEDQDVELGLVYNLKEQILALYQKPATAHSAVLPQEMKNDGYHFVRPRGSLKIEIFRPIYNNTKRIGTLYVLSNLDSFKEQVLSSLFVLVACMLIILLVTQLVARRVQRLITEPLYHLAGTVRKITQLGDYTVRVKQTSYDEIGELIDNFNAMLTAIQIRDSELNQHRHNLELIVEERTEELREKRDEALAASQAKTEFLANMSHEIRTPMNGVIGVLSLLKGTSLNEEQKRLLETATRSADSLMFIINDILDFSKIDAGMIEFESIPFDLRAVVDETVYLFVDSVNSHKIDLMSFIPEEVHCYVEGDPTRLRQVLTNLVGNAVKFTSEGEIVLMVELIERREGDQLLRFSVTDTGIGIPKSSLSSLFEKFTQADGSTTRKYGGTGLGLSVCKQLVEMQGGDIGVESELNQGATFWFTLPFRTIPASSFVFPRRALDSKRILVVDDNRTNRKILKHYLSTCNVLLDLCSSGAEALQVLENSTLQGRPVDMALIDFHMKEMSGIQLAERIISTFGETAPEMFLLSSGSIGRDEAMIAGFKATILKPVLQSQLFDILVNRSGIPAGLQEEDRPPVPKATFSGKILLVDDEEINLKVACASLEKFGLEIDLASDGAEAVSMSGELKYDIILMDIQMPEISGFEATRLIRKREAMTGADRVTIIAMTANAMKSTRRQCLEVGMDDFISKPIKPEALMRRLKPWLEGARDKHVLIDEVPDTAVSTANTDDSAVWDRSRALQLAGDDEELLGQLINMFLQKKETLLQKVENAVLLKQPELLDNAAHAYKGVLNHFAAERSLKVARRLEQKGKSGDMSGVDALWKELAELSDELAVSLRKAA